MVRQYRITLSACSIGYHLITRQIPDAVGALPEKGLIHVFIRHTSAGLMINENADPSVRRDFETFMNDMVSED
ncbi:MAG: YjbQ family protein [Chlorobi bacterium]|nr:YjbQ family protein [Chlorobiota bacterium]